MAIFRALGLDHDRPPPDAIITAGRFSSVFLALITIASVFWAGHTIGGNRTARSAALALIACPFFLWHARLATPAIHLVVWPSLAFASAIWAIRPLRPAPSIIRQLVGWGLCGLALGTACLTAGSVALLTVPVPIVLALVLSPRRISHTLGLLAALAIAGLIVVPWALVAHAHDPDLYQHWLAKINPSRARTVDHFKAAAITTALVPAVLLPWTLWLIGSVVQSFSPSPGHHRRKTLICWFWLLTGCVVPWLTAGDQVLDALLLVLPAGALLIGYTFAQYADSAAEARRAITWSWLQWPFILILGALSLAPLLAEYLQHALVNYRVLDVPLIHDWNYPVMIAQSVALLVILGFAVRWVVKDYPTRALACWSLWATAMFCFAILPLSRANPNAAKNDALIVRTLTTSHPLYWYTLPDLNRATPEPALQVYCATPIIPMRQDTKTTMPTQSRYFLLTPQIGPGPIHHQLRPAIPTLVGHLPRLGMEIWRVDPNSDTHQAH